jgi:Ca2+-binding RTX toxin-like protein
VFISSEANQNIENARTVDVLLGWLDYMEEDLVVDVGTGRHRLLISDEKSLIAKGRAILSNNSLTNLHEDLGDIFFSSKGVFAWAGGVDLWLGKGDDYLDVISVPSNPDSQTLRTTTCINAGDGNDSINIALATENHDGVVFVANGQAGSDLINATLSTHPVILFGGRGSDTLVGGSGSDVLLGDLGRVLWRANDGGVGSPGHNTFNHSSDSASISNGDGIVVAQVGGGGYGDFSDGIRRNASIVVSLFNDVGDDDILDCGNGDNVGIGGFGADRITGGAHRDILVSNVPTFCIVKA